MKVKGGCQWAAPIVLAILLLTSTVSSVHGEGITRGRSPFERFPFYEDIPSNTYALLHEGNLYGTRWVTYVYRSREGGRFARKSPCLFLGSITKEGSYSNAYGCGPLAPGGDSNAVPVFPLTTNSDGARNESFGALTFNKSVKRVALELDTGETLHFKTKLVLASEAAQARVDRFRVVTFGLAREVCVNEVRAFDSAGTVVMRSPLEEECP
jgi:hypothetical protein